MACISKAPGRICLFGDHQDYLSLPVIACSIDRFVTITGTPNNDKIFKISMPDLGDYFELSFCKNVPTSHNHDLMNALTVLGRYGCFPDEGYDLTFTSDVPINAGLSSSSAVVVAWIQWLVHTFGCNTAVTPIFLGKIAYEAEVLEKGSPGGKMDQYTSAIGGTIYLETDEKSKIEILNNHPITLIIAESGIPKDTSGLLGHVKGKQLNAIASAQKIEPTFSISTATLTDFDRLKKYLSQEDQSYLYAAIKNHQITKESLEHFRKSELNTSIVGRLITEHHTILKDYLKITTPKIDVMIASALEAGAFGAKIVGSGGGGSLVAISSKQNKENIINAFKKGGAVAAYEVQIDKGAHIL